MSNQGSGTEVQQKVCQNLNHTVKQERQDMFDIQTTEVQGDELRLYTLGKWSGNQKELSEQGGMELRRLYMT